MDSNPGTSGLSALVAGPRRSIRNVAFASLVAASAAAACRGGEGPPAADLTTNAVQPPGATAVEPAEPGHAPAAEEPDSLVADAVDPSDLAAQIERAIAANDGAAAQTAFRELGLRLSELRGADRVDEVVPAVVRFAAAENDGLWRQVDGRYVVPAVEVLLDAGRDEEVLRLTEWYASGPASAAMATARSAAERRLGARRPSPE